MSLPRPQTQKSNPDYVVGMEDGVPVLIPAAFDAKSGGTSQMQRFPMGNLQLLGVVSLAYNPGSIAANTVAADSALTLAGVKVGDVVLAAIKPTQTAGLGVVGARVSADDTVIVSFVNATAAPIDAASETWTFVIARPAPDLSVPATFG